MDKQEEKKQRLLFPIKSKTITELSMILLLGE